MKYQKHTTPVQQLANGAELAVSSYVFTSGKPGPTVYLQGNLHGPEVFGTALLLELIAALAKKEEIPGTVVIVPCANPMGVTNVAYNAIVGRWNAQSGTNWNRIFPTDPVKSRADEKAYYADLAAQPNLSIEKKLAATLRTLSAGADLILDIHTTGSASAKHLFTFADMHDAFRELRVALHLVNDSAQTGGAFDESHVFQARGWGPGEKTPKSATWEAHHHGNIDHQTLEQRLSQVVHWLENVWGNASADGPEPAIYESHGHLYAPVGGYYSWTKPLGATVRKGEEYAIVYQPQDGSITPVTAELDFVLIATYGNAATASGEQIAWVAFP